jgi:hypothetical protein
MLWQTQLFLLVCLWTIAYAFAIVHAIKYKSHGIPALSVALNYAWEVLATIYYREYVGIVWCLVDTVIVYFIIKEYKRQKLQLIISLLSFVISSVACVLFFEHTVVPGLNGFVFICFLIDLIMAADFVYEISFGKIAVNPITLCIAFFKLLGDYMAWNMYRRNKIILAIGLCVLVLNIIYLIVVCIRLTRRNDVRHKD